VGRVSSDPLYSSSSGETLSRLTKSLGVVVLVGDRYKFVSFIAKFTLASSWETT